MKSCGDCVPNKPSMPRQTRPLLLVVLHMVFVLLNERDPLKDIRYLGSLAIVLSTAAHPTKFWSTIACPAMIGRFPATPRDWQ
jgi:hypothetical protein